MPRGNVMRANFSPITRTEVESDIARGRRRLTVHSRTPVAGVQAIDRLEPSPLHSIEAFGAAMFVATVAACWIAVASTATAPLIAAGELLTRASRALDR